MVKEAIARKPVHFAGMKWAGCCIVLLVPLLLSSCAQREPNGLVAPGESTDNPKQQSFEVRLFEVADSNRKLHGWGYDIYINSTRTIHQPIIPAIQGNNPFKTRADAQRTGEFVVNKIKATGSLPTLTPNDLDSLGVTK